MSNIVKHFIKFVFPFTYDLGKINPENAVTDNGNRIFNRFSQKSESLREGLGSLFSENGGSAKIVDCFELDANAKSQFYLPSQRADGKHHVSENDKYNKYLEFKCRDKERFLVGINNIRLYLFESKVAFIEIECVYESDSLDDYQKLSYFIAEAKSEENEFTYFKRLYNKSTQSAYYEKHSFSMKSLIKTVLNSACCGNESAVHISYDTLSPIIYSYLLIDKRPADMESFIFHLSKNFKSSYKYDESCTPVSTLHPFENSYWTASLSGVTNISFFTDDDVTNNFFIDNFYTKTLNVYYFLFLSVIHQRYAISKITADMGRLDCLGHDYFIMQNQLRDARACSSDAINLKFRAFFKQPSTVEHVNLYYELISRAFQTYELYSSFNQDIATLQSICKKYVDRIEERENTFKKRAGIRAEIFVSIFGVIVAEATLFNSSWALIEKIFGKSLSFGSPAVIFLLIAALAPVIPVIISVKKQISELNFLKAQLKSDVADNLVEDDKTMIKNKKRFSKLINEREKMRKREAKKAAHKSKKSSSQLCE